MKSNLVVLFVGFIFFALVSCQKEVSSENSTPPPGGSGNPTPGGGSQPPSGNGKLYRIRQGLHQDITEDTVLLISHNGAGKIRSIVDSLEEDSSVAEYDVTGRLSTITRPSGENLYCLYDPNGLLTQIGYKVAGERRRLNFYYTNGVLERQTYYTDHGSGREPELWREYLYVIVAGNITQFDEWDKSGRHLSTYFFEYSQQPNQLKQLSLFNYGNRYGFQRLGDFNSYFNNNLIVKITYFGSNTPHSTTVYTMNSQQLLTKVVVNNQDSSVFTWQFFYR